MVKRLIKSWWIPMVILLCAGIIVILDIPSWQSLDMNRLNDVHQTTYVYDESGEVAAELHAGENRVLLTFDEIPKHVRNAFIAIEDARFYEHPGIDILRMGGALIRNLQTGSYREGASTITQQLIKLTHLTSEKTLSRKAQEIWISLQLERRLDKDSILCAYLNTAYFGKGAYGIEAASRVYFDKTCAELTVSEAALLAGVVKAPGNYAPHIDFERSIERRDTVIRAMRKEEYLTEDEAEIALKEKIVLVEEDRLQADGDWYIDGVLTEAANVLDCSIEEVLSGGYRIYSSLQPAMQNAAELLYRSAEYFPGNAEDGTVPESALIALNPENGEVMCMIGGRNYATRLGLNRAMQIKRQPGSTFKPISVYAAAIDFLNYTPLSLVNDTARDFGGGYSPSNASGREYGIVTLRQALTKSMNLAAVDLITKTGIETACMYAQRAGIELNENDYNLSIALGSLSTGVSPAELSAAYAPLVNGGSSVEPHTIRKIENKHGEIIYEYTGEASHVMTEQSGRMIISMLEEAAQSGTASQLAAVEFPVAAKTGTVGYVNGGNTDAWTVALTPSVSIAVWLGFDRPDNDHILPEGTTGGGYPARLAAAFLKCTSSVSNGGMFRIPDGMTRVLLDRAAIDEYHMPMLAGEHTPTEYLIDEILSCAKIPVLTSDLWNAPKQVEHIYLQTSESGNPIVSFIVPDSNARYRIIRDIDGIQTEVGCVEGKAGEYLSFEDTGLLSGGIAEYRVVSQHKRFYSLGRIWESEPSESAIFRPQSFLEKMINQGSLQSEEGSFPLFPQ
ncbi:MAG: PBP1A family penicillin-binding protein [Clostridia bacterium]|nr:PBP1A family penicillin-binding protein [Clostridia bacterium]